VDASSTSELVPLQPALMSVIGVIRGAVAAALGARVVWWLAGVVVQAVAAARIRTGSATAGAIGRSGRISMYHAR
jgi:hypothetical protein